MRQRNFFWAGCRLALSGLIFLSCLAGPVAAGESLSTGERASLQAVMQRHIANRLVDGVYLQVDFEQGTVRRLHPVAAHPMILQLEDFYVLCTDFRDDSGKAVNVDFYLARKGPSHLVFQTMIDDRAALEQLIKRGKAQPIS